MTLHPLSREKWFHPEAYAENRFPGVNNDTPDYHPDAVQQLRDRVSRQPYWRAWLNEHATAAWFGFAAGVVSVAVPCAVAWLVVLS